MKPGEQAVARAVTVADDRAQARWLGGSPASADSSSRTSTAAVRDAGESDRKLQARRSRVLSP